MKKKPVKKQVSKKKKNPTGVLPIYSSADDVPSDADMPVTKGHFDAFRQELTARMTSSELLIKANDKKNAARFVGIDSQIKEMDGRFEARFAAIDSKFKKMDAKFEARFAAIDARFKEMDAKFEARFAAIDARFATLEKKIEDVYIQVQRTNVLMEEQNNRNKLVMDALMSLLNRQDSLEKKVDERIKNLEDIIKMPRA